ISRSSSSACRSDAATSSSISRIACLSSASGSSMRSSTACTSAVKSRDIRFMRAISSTSSGVSCVNVRNEEQRRLAGRRSLRPQNANFPARRLQRIYTPRPKELLAYASRRGCSRKPMEEQKSRILVVEDEAAIRNGLTDVLVYHGYRVDAVGDRSEEHTSELQSRENLVCRLLLEKK